LIQDGLREALAPFRSCDLTGVTCLAKGADQIFAQLVLDLGGRLEVIIPAADYDRIPDPVESARFQALLEAAAAVHRMPFDAVGPAAYFAASQELIRRSDVLLAVWDGGPPDGRGGTADAIEFARRSGRQPVVVWPIGAARR
jgi:hypothetical protein